MVLSFDRFDTESCCATVRIYNGPSASESALIAERSGLMGTNSGSPWTFSTSGDGQSGDSMLIVFTAGEGVLNGLGFSATYQMGTEGQRSMGWDAHTFSSSSGTACSGLAELSTATGTIEDGSQPSARYAANSNCTWNISPGYNNIQIQFDRFNLKTDWDWLEVRELVPGEEPVVLARLTGPDIPDPVRTHSQAGSVQVRVERRSIAP